MVDVRNLVEQANQSVASLAEVSEALAEDLTAALRSLPGKLREIEVPRVKKSLADIAQQLSAIGARLRRLSQHLDRGAERLAEPALQDSGRLIVEGFEAISKLASLLRPGEASLFRYVPDVFARPYVEAITKVETGWRAASDLADIAIKALPDISAGMNDIGEDLGRAADLLDATANTIRELSDIVPL
jgi:methyl-accepting chemotaxis protein